ncbi:TetR/AcrR family transcriptional regulator [Nocardioides donggukensis]|uniref:TetR/AcrR family transcriptional regulator n=1 Tax=Nocardioides donggukensis TaxID=2774019 RepID=A0A927K2D7_9ACTN|nr:TetR/AcrR family transcriptional regulator [Nocardioides donggukensis]MBD8868522.1 TetR/AcrR family transcriptional regulator [Nocardioides donggukensis]
MGRREQLLEGATDHVLESGLIGLSLRPLGEALGTSDRMLLYHFGSRAELVTAIIDSANDRAIATLSTVPRGRTVRAGVLRLWEAFREEPLRSCEDLYVQAAASGLLGEEPYRSGVRRSNERWMQALGGFLGDCGARPARVARVTRLVDVGLLGLHVDLAVDAPEELDRAARDLADAAHALAR